MPTHYRWDAQARLWRPRERAAVGHRVLGRVHAAAPADQERFYLYLLLLHVRGATSWEDLRTARGHVHASWRAAAEARDLVDTDDEYLQCMREAAGLQRPRQLRTFFAHMLLQCELKNAGDFWKTFAAELAEDHRFQGHGDDAARSLALEDIQRVLARGGRQLQEFGLPAPSSFDAEAFAFRALRAARAFDASEEQRRAAAQRRTLRADQAAVFDAVAAALETREGGVFFIDGPGGSGKTYLEETLLHHVRGQGRVASPCAWSGIAATLLTGGKTCHSLFGFPVPLPTEDVTSSISAQTGRAALLRETALFVWDEAPMSPREAVEGAHKLLSFLAGDSRPFAGKVVVFSGDFRQVLPVIPGGSRADVVAHSLRHHPFWERGLVRSFELRGNARAREDAGFAEFLLRLGDGLEPVHADVSPYAVRLPEELAAPCEWTAAHLVHDTFPDLVRRAQRCGAARPPDEDLEFFAKRAILTPTNAAADEVNAHVVKSWEDAKGAVHEYASRDSIRDGQPEDWANYPVDFLNSLNPAGLPPHRLRVFPGAVVVVLRNLDAEAGVCNGTRAVVKAAHRHVLDVQLLTGRAKGQRIFVPRLLLTPNTRELPFALARKQFPLRLAYGMTINKAQGQSLTRVGVYLPAPVFSHGQLYVALSRVGSFSHARVLVRETEEQGPRGAEHGVPQGVYTPNVVWPEALGREEGRRSAQAPAPPDAEAAAEHDDARRLDEPARLAAQDPTAADDVDEAARREASAGGAEPDDPADGDARYPGYFERQREAQCGLHAVNNILGRPFLTAADLRVACDKFLAEMAFEGVVEDRAQHIGPGGFYSEAVLAFALRHFGNAFALDLDRPILPDTAMPLEIFLDDVAGILVNVAQRHWVAVRVCLDDLWMLDSLTEPERLTLDQLRDFLRRHPSAFFVRRLRGAG